MSRRRTASGWPICPHLHTGHNTSAVIAVVIAMGPCVHLRAKTRLPAAGQWPSAVLTGISDQQQLDQIVVLSIQPASSRRWHAGRSRTAEPKRLRRKGPRRGRGGCAAVVNTQRSAAGARRGVEGGKIIQTRYRFKETWGSREPGTLTFPVHVSSGNNMGNKEFLVTSTRGAPASWGFCGL